MMAGAWAPPAIDWDDAGDDPTGSPGRGNTARWSTAWDVPRSPAAVSRVRRALGALLHRLGVRPDACDAALLVAHELVVNGVEHGRTGVRLTVGLVADAIRIDVHDGSPVQPRLQPRDPAAPRGRGLQMVEGLAANWGWRLDGDGKTVWAEVPTAGGHPGSAA
jgi:anti-sigma regulatory factor (Ser/Thr protein kinase)